MNLFSKGQVHKSCLTTIIIHSLGFNPFPYLVVTYKTHNSHWWLWILLIERQMQSFEKPTPQWLRWIIGSKKRTVPLFSAVRTLQNNKLEAGSRCRNLIQSPGWDWHRWQQHTGVWLLLLLRAWCKNKYRQGPPLQLQCVCVCVCVCVWKPHTRRDGAVGLHFDCPLPTPRLFVDCTVR